MLERISKSRLMVGAAICAVGLPMAASAQNSADPASSGDIIVTARRVEERLQDVPISITVYNQQQISNRNIAVATDLATYTPSLSVNQRYGPEKSAFSLRGFVQDQNTAPTVGVYFADVVGVRAQGGTTSGNTVGAGSFTDLQNVQVLKGPQGTLFGRNTTGGAVLLVPKKPADRLEGYVEGTYGNYDQKRVQAALNIPLADSFKVRFSLDHNSRDGYMKNRSGVGASAYNDVNYFYGRLSILADLTPDLENYTIATYSNSNTNGYAARLVLCDRAYVADALLPGSASAPILAGRVNTRLATAGGACDQIDRQAARGDGLLDVEVGNPDPFLKLKTWQVINTTTWRVSDSLTLKNIISYGEFRERTNFSLNSDNFFVPSQFSGVLPASVGQPFNYILLATAPFEDNASQSNFTEELQLQWHGEKFEMVAGGYLERSSPLGWSAGRTSINGACADTENLICTSPLGATIISASRTKIRFSNSGVFAQGTYRLSDSLSLTAGVRYTIDKITGESESVRLILGPTGAQLPVGGLGCNDARANGGAAPTSISQCNVYTGLTFANGQSIKRPQSKKPTWVVNLDYKPTEDVLLYGKWSRGYRQGGLTFTNPGLETWEPEKVDTYEVGAKASFSGAVHGYLNVAGFYNNFTNQQIFGSLIAKPDSALSGGAAIINAGKSEIYGFEVDASLSPFEGLRVDAGYTYLHATIKELIAPVLAADSPFSQIIPSGVAGSRLSLTPTHRLTVTGTYTLPLDESVGKVSLAGTYTYTSSQIPATASPLGVLPATNLFNLNLNWDKVAGSPIDVAAFVTNLTDTKYFVSVGGAFASAGFENVLLGQPRIFGVRVRYSFGD